MRMVEPGCDLLVIFGGHHECATLKTIISRKANIWNRHVSNIPEVLSFIICLRIPLFQIIDPLFILADGRSGRVICWLFFVDVIKG